MQKYCLIGHPVAHSRSPKMHNKWFKEKGISAEYVPQDVLPEQLPVFMENYRKEFAGGNVTIPHKEAVCAYLDHIDETAQQIGAVNVIRNDGGMLFGFNTDWIGALQALREGFGFLIENFDEQWLSGKTAMILGAGGAARAVAYGVSRAGGKIIILNRTVDKARNIAEFYEGEFGSLDEWERFLPDIVVNATSVGLAKDSTSPLPKAAFEFWEKKRSAGIAGSTMSGGGSAARPAAALDIVFNPPETQFLKDAAAASWKIIRGERMLYFQAVESFKIWTGK